MPTCCYWNIIVAVYLIKSWVFSKLKKIPVLKYQKVLSYKVRSMNFQCYFRSASSLWRMLKNAGSSIMSTTFLAERFLSNWWFGIRWRRTRGLFLTKLIFEINMIILKNCVVKTMIFPLSHKLWLKRSVGFVVKNILNTVLILRVSLNNFRIFRLQIVMLHNFCMTFHIS